MTEQVLNDDLARRFLLGQLSPEEQGRIEELAFKDPDTFAFLQAAEEDLVDEFLYDELSPAEKELFQKHFLTKPGRRQNLRIARALKQYLDDDVPVAAAVISKSTDPKPKGTFFQWFRLGALSAPLVIAAIVITSGVGLLVAIQIGRQDDDTPSQAHIQPSPVPTPSASPAASPVPSASSPTPQDNQNKRSPTPPQPSEPVYAVVLAPTAALRSEDGTELKQVKRTAGPIGVELPVVSVIPYRSYQASLLSDEKTIQTWRNLKPRELSAGRGILLIVQPGQLAESQRYQIVLNGITANGQMQIVHYYYFQVSE